MVAGEQRQFADDLSDGRATGETNQSLAGQSSDQVRVSNGLLHGHQRQQHLSDAVSADHSVQQLLEKSTSPSYLYTVVVLDHLPHASQHMRGGGLLGAEGCLEGTHSVWTLVWSADAVYDQLRGGKVHFYVDIVNVEQV